MRVVVFAVSVMAGLVAYAGCHSVNKASSPQVKCLQERIAKLETMVAELDAVAKPRIAVADVAKMDSFYAERYSELKSVHDRFMAYINGFLVALGILVAIAGVGTTIFGIIKPQKSQKRIEAEWKTITHEVSTITISRAKFSLASMKLDWVDFLYRVNDKKAKEKDIARPLFTLVQCLYLVSRSTDDSLLLSCISSADRIIGLYRRAVLKDGQHIQFVRWVRKHNMFTSSLLDCDFKNYKHLASFDTVCTWLNEFGINIP